MQCAIRSLVVIYCVLLGLAPAHAEKRVALVIGNSAYQHTRPLPNPRNDAEAIAKLLRINGFDEVTLKTDLAYQPMREAVRMFGRAAQEAGVSLIYFAGHGLEIAGENYLIPTDARLVRDAELEYEAVTLASLLTAASAARRLRAVILDACRNNPLGERIALRAGVMRAVARGLARIEPTGDVLVAYAAKAGTLAEDGKGRHSPYAEALLKHMATPGLDVRLMFGKVRDEVLIATRQRQEPYIYGALTGDVVALFPAKPATSAQQVELMFWASVKESKSPAVLSTYLDRYPNGEFAPVARALIEHYEGQLKLEQAKQKKEGRQEEEKAAKEAKKVEAAKKLEEELAANEAAKAVERQRTAAIKKAEDAKKEAAAMAAKEAAERAEVEGWAAVKDATDIATLETFVVQYQGTSSAELARARIDELKKQQIAAAGLPLTTTPMREPADTDSAVLVRALLAELRRVGCDPGSADGVWGHRAKQALGEFARLAKISIPGDEPSEAVLRAVTEQEGRVCPLRCGRRQIKVSGKCVAKAYPAPTRSKDAATKEPQAERQKFRREDSPVCRDCLSRRGTTYTPKRRASCVASGKCQP